MNLRTSITYSVQIPYGHLLPFTMVYGHPKLHYMNPYALNMVYGHPKLLYMKTFWPSLWFMDTPSYTIVSPLYLL